MQTSHHKSTSLSSASSRQRPSSIATKSFRASSMSATPHGWSFRILPKPREDANNTPKLPIFGNMNAALRGFVLEVPMSPSPSSPEDALISPDALRPTSVIKDTSNLGQLQTAFLSSSASSESEEQVVTVDSNESIMSEILDAISLSIQTGSKNSCKSCTNSSSCCSSTCASEEPAAKSETVHFMTERQTNTEPRGSSDASETTVEVSKPSRTSTYLKEQFQSFFQPADNKLALKLFGSRTALMKEKIRQQATGKWVIHPCSSFRFHWDLLMLTFLIANVIILPVAISFFNDDLSFHWVLFNCGSDTIFLLDIFVNFRTGVIGNNNADDIILDPRKIASHYVRSWFCLDFISSIPMDYIFLLMKKNDYTHFVHAGRTLRIIRLVKLLSMLRLLRLSRLVRYVNQWEEFLNIASKFMGICNLVLLMLLLGHWNACLQFLVPMLMDYPPESWVMRSRLKDEPFFEQYTWSLFKAMSHMLSMGYGRFPPISMMEAWVTIISVMTGSTCYALFVGHAAALIHSFDTSKRLYREKFKQVEEYMAYRKLPRALRQRIADYYEHRYQGKMFIESSILNELSECLRQHIVNYNCRALVAAVPFFTHADPDFVSAVVSQLKYEVFQPGDLIIKEGTIGTKMYFIQEGIVDIITRDGTVATSLSDGSYFGEICLLTNSRRVASIRAVVYCNVYSLDRESFLYVLTNYPLMRRTLESVAAERLSKIGQNPCLVTSPENLTEDLDLVKEIVESMPPLSSSEEDDSSSRKSSKSSQHSVTAVGSAANRRKSIVQIGLQKLGFRKSISCSAAADMMRAGERNLIRSILKKDMPHSLTQPRLSVNDSDQDKKTNDSPLKLPCQS